jgi:hypothetical protein
MHPQYPAGRADVVEQEADWVVFPGGELEGRRPKVLCGACRSRRPAGPAAALCFECYRAERARERKLEAAGRLATASPERFQHLLPFEPVNRARLERLRVERETARASLQRGTDRFAQRRRQAQLSACRALRNLAAELSARDAGAAEKARSIMAAVHAAELQLPDAWLPFVVRQ